jgi:predicted DNA-binding transcriptional regulator AlpA
VTVDPTELIDAGEVAELLGLARRQAVSTYRRRYADFPSPVVEKNSGKCDLWLRTDIERWKKRTGRPQSTDSAGRRDLNAFHAKRQKS